MATADLALLDEIARQSRRNEFLTVVLIAAAIANVLLIAVLMGGVLAPAFALLTILIVTLWVAITYLIFNSMVLHVTRARPLHRHEERRLQPLVARLAGQLGIPAPRLQALDDDVPNAFAVGAGPQATVAYTTGLLNLLENDELEGVTAHELAHLANGDTRIALASAAVLGWAVVVSGVVTTIALGVLSGGFGLLSGRRENGDVAEVLACICLGLVLIVAAIATWLATQAWFLIAWLTHLAIFRQREWLADATAARITGKPLSLAHALEQATGVEVSLSHGARLTRALCIFGRREGTWWDELFCTHPDSRQRIARLRGYATYREN